MTVWEALLLWFGLIENKAFDLEQQAESPRVIALVKKKRGVSGLQHWRAHLTAVSFNKDEPVMPFSI